MQYRRIIVALMLALFVGGCAQQLGKVVVYDYSGMDKDTKDVHKKVEKILQQGVATRQPVPVYPATRIDSVRIDKFHQKINIYLNPIFGYIPWRENNVASTYAALKEQLGRKYRNYQVILFSKDFPIESLIPNAFRSDTSTYDTARMPRQDVRTLPLVMNMNRPWYPTKGLFNRNIALWHSHGWYFEQSENRWEWQRARLFQTVEDIGPIGFTLPYLVPMLENAGALVMLPRERDTQTHEIIIDNDNSRDWDTFYSEEIYDLQNELLIESDSVGFAVGNPPYGVGENPFQQGTYRRMPADTVVSAEISWIPEFPAPGDYAVYISWKRSDSNVTDAHYTVYHSGGQTDFLVNQQIGGATWIYLGTYRFYAGYNPEIGRVSLTNQSDEVGSWVTADAVRFGGGMGNVSRHGQTSGRPRYVEGARYYLQYAGMPDTLVFSLNNEESDYKDDYQSRGEWVNYLKGAPFGPNADRTDPGLGIPIDLSLAFHTDAGIALHDTVIGTLAIYSSEGADSTTFFPDSMSRLANRDFADMLQTQIVNDLRATWDPLWRRRGMWDKQYSEAFRPNVPAVLLELLSHQSFLDMTFFQDPRFKFDASRSIYKALLRFEAMQYQTDYVVQPLPVDHFQAVLHPKSSVTLSWQPVDDPLEPTAVAEKYIVYTRLEGDGWDNGVLVDSTIAAFDSLLPGVIYSYKVTAVNAGGESFPSEILSVCWYEQDTPPVLIINAFDRVAAPAKIITDQFAGFANFHDQGVPDKYDLNFTGDQIDFSPTSQWKDDDSPGFGASYANLETTIIAGNSFDYPYIHGVSIRAAGHAFCSVSDEVVIQQEIDLKNYPIVDVVLGEEKTTGWPKPMGEKQFQAWPEPFRQAISDYCSAGGNLFVSGSYVGADIYANQSPDTAALVFSNKMLKFIWRTNHASKGGGVWCVDSTFMDFGTAFEFNTMPHPDIYAAEAPDGIAPVDSMTSAILRYQENNIGAAVAYRGKKYSIIVFGFPFETIIEQDARDNVMNHVLGMFEEQIMKAGVSTNNNRDIKTDTAIDPDAPND
ncbi:fibronectin type III domain-containing protein [candidate division KSB1 bacterium]|nr:fibronectin type III domain-containing protein [candidate division KSB1 bacterium]